MTTRLEEWAKHVETNPYLAPELRTSFLTGIVYNHPAFQDGQRIATSPIVGRSGNLVVTSSGSKYELGTAHERYESRYPGAKDRLLESLAPMPNQGKP